uniref:Uncharacterized protein n=1 Tax=Arundo donax TaxID=35708 RepID=A0A0A9ADY4_ARUDO
MMKSLKWTKDGLESNIQVMALTEIKGKRQET